MTAVAVHQPNQQARYGMSYVRAVLAQAGVGFSGTESDDDVFAIDGTIRWAEGTVGVQVKCTTRTKIAGKSVSWKLEPHWVDSWSTSKLPVYLVAVIVPPLPADWLAHPPDGTIHRTAAFWRRLDDANLSGPRVSVPKHQRFTATTPTIWWQDLMDCFTPTGGAP